MCVEGAFAKVGLTLEQDNVTFLAVSKDNRWVVSTSSDSLICIRDRRMGRSLWEIAADGRIPSPSFNSKEGIVAIPRPDLSVDFCTRNFLHVLRVAQS